jgi:hypothetical protein
MIFLYMVERLERIYEIIFGSKAYHNMRNFHAVAMHGQFSLVYSNENYNTTCCLLLLWIRANPFGGHCDNEQGRLESAD